MRTRITRPIPRNTNKKVVSMKHFLFVNELGAYIGLALSKVRILELTGTLQTSFLAYAYQTPDQSGPEQTRPATGMYPVPDYHVAYCILIFPQVFACCSISWICLQTISLESFYMLFLAISRHHLTSPLLLSCATRGKSTYFHIFTTPYRYVLRRT